MKTYFMAWESDNKRGHACWEFGDGTDPRDALRHMIASIEEEFADCEIPLKGVVTALQFHRVD